MITLDSTTKSLEIVLAGAVTTNQLPFAISYADIDSTTFAVTGIGGNDGVTNNTTAVSIVPAPGAGKVRKVTFLSIYNADTVAAILTIRLNNGGTTRILSKTTMAVGDSLEWD